MGSRSKGGARSIVNNTVFAPEGDALWIGVANVQLRNNLLWSEGDYALFLTAAAQVGFMSDYNLLFATDGASLGFWQGIVRDTLADWQTAASLDGSSLSQDPLFVDMDGADGTLGFGGAAADGRDDDFHLQSTVGSFHGGAQAPVIDASSGLPAFLAPVESVDSSQSPAIDRGAAADPFALEPTPSGGFINLGAYGNTAQASKSPAEYVLVVVPDGGDTWPAEQTFTIAWRSHDMVGTVDVELFEVGNTTPVLTIADDAPNDGEQSWTVPLSVVPGTDYLIRVTRNDGALVFDESNDPFEITGPVSIFYVNDDTVLPGDYTTEPGDDANTGTTPDSPKASIQAVLDSFQLGAGDTILVDNGIYILTQNISISDNDSGVTIEGFHDPAFPDRVSLIDRANTGTGTVVIQLAGADDVTISYLSITGARQGISAPDGADSDGLTVSNSRVFGNWFDGIYLGTSNDGAVITGNEIFGIPGGSSFDNQNDGVRILGADALITDNELYENLSSGLNLNGARGVASGNVIYRNGYGILANFAGGSADRIVISGNEVFDNIINPNGRQGIRVSGAVLVTDNDVYGHNSASSNTGIHLVDRAQAIGNRVHHNTGNGIYASGHGEVRDNDVYANGTGINRDGSSAIVGNRVYSNNIGIIATQVRGGTDGGVSNNLIYSNTAVGIVTGFRFALTIQNNTIYQPTGDAVQLTGASNKTIRNNILWVEDGYAISVSTNSQVGFQSDYNLFHTPGNGRVAQWQGLDFVNLVDWFLEVGFDANSREGDPGFVDLAGADGILGYDGVTEVNGGADDNFHLTPGSVAIDAGNPNNAYFEEPGRTAIG